MKTDAQRAADAQLEAAIGVAAAAYELVPGDATLIDYVTVIEAITLDDAGDIDVEHHGLIYRQGHARSAVALGLLAQGTAMIMRQAVEE